jgi:aminoglycoside phosphotransferase (APT) family kinase protein
MNERRHDQDFRMDCASTQSIFGEHPATLNEANIGAFLTGRFKQIVGPIALVGKGTFSKAYSFHCSGKDYIVRFSPFAEDFAKDLYAAQRFSSSALPIPWIMEVGEALGGFYAISDRIDGDHLDDVQGQQMRDLRPAIFSVLDAMRAADVTSSGGYGAWGAQGDGPHPSWREALLDVVNDRPEMRTHGWRDRLRSSPTGDGPFEQALRTFKGLVVDVPEERHLVHSDLLHFNLLVKGNRVTASLIGAALCTVTFFTMLPGSPSGLPGIQLGTA